MKHFAKVLVANRGEIAVRILRTCKRLGYRTVAVFSEADRDAPHVRMADEAVPIGPSPAKESYLVIEKILAAAKISSADSIHPGYGFLSENEHFAHACREAGLVFIGPPADAIALMGNKRRAKQRMAAAGVPCIPGFDAAGADDETLVREGRTLGFPIMVKAAAGGGGRGMRLVREASDLAQAIASARSEAKNAFGDDELILERAIVGARHVEIQIFADGYGNVVHLAERDCSIQRRHQKIVEESPSPAVTPDLRRRMGDVAVAAARAIEYRGAGTLEFLLAPNGEFYFMEMNTRLQVEHPVTEAVTDLDLVEWQLRVAAGGVLPRTQEQITFTGHAIEVRLCAEDPASGYLPQTGRALAWAPPSGEGIRVDHALDVGQEISSFYDSMQAKVVAHGPDRETARRRLVDALGRLTLFGVTTNKNLLSYALEHEAFRSGNYDTGFTGEHAGPEVLRRLYTPSSKQNALAATLFVHDDGLRLARHRNFDDAMLGWSSAYAPPIPLTLRTNDAQGASVRPAGRNAYDVRLGELAFEITDVHVKAGEFAYTIDRVLSHARFARDGGHTLWMDTEGSVNRFEDVTLAPRASGREKGTGRLRAPMNGRVLRVNTRPGDTVNVGDVLAVLEAMKMEMSLTADIDGVVAEVNVSAGQQVTTGQLVVAIEPAPP